MFSVYDPLALTIRDSWSFIGNSGGTGKNKDYRDQNTGSMETAAAEYRNLYGSRHAFGVCTSKTPGNDVWVTSYMKENRSEAEIRKSENDKEEMS